MTFLKLPMAYLEQYYSTASAAPCVSLSPASHIAESAGNKIKAITVPPTLPPMEPSATARTKKMRKKATALAAPAALSDDALTAMPTSSTAPATKKGKPTGKKKATKSIDLCGMAMGVKTTDGASHR
jgi:hypothetical protein